MATLTIRKLKTLLKHRFKGVLKSGKHQEDGEACVRELRSCALGIPWTDTPDGGSATDSLCQSLNDAPWSSDEVRAKECLELALLTESEAAPGWVARLAERTIREIAPRALDAAASIHPDKIHAAAMRHHATKCTEQGTAAASWDAAEAALAAASAAWDAAGGASAAARAASAAGDAASAAGRAASAAGAAAGAAARAAWAAARDNVLRKAVRIALDCHRGIHTEE